MAGAFRDTSGAVEFLEIRSEIRLNDEFSSLSFGLLQQSHHAEYGRPEDQRYAKEQ